MFKWIEELLCRRECVDKLRAEHERELSDLKGKNSRLVANAAKQVDELMALRRRIRDQDVQDELWRKRQEENEKVKKTFRSMDRAITSRNKQIETLHGIAIDLDAQVTDALNPMHEGDDSPLFVERTTTASIKSEAQDRAAAAILLMYSLPSTKRLSNKNAKALEKAIAEIADNI